MHSIRLVGIMCFLIALTGCGKSGSTKPGDSSRWDSLPGPTKIAEATVKEKLIGTWEAVKINDQPPAKGVSVTMEFTNDGKCIRIDQRAGKTETEEATYMLDNMKITVTVNTATKKGFSIMMIQSITDKQLIVKGAQNFDFKKK